MPRKPTRGHQAVRQYPERKPRGDAPDPSGAEESTALRAKEEKGRPGYGQVDPKTAPPKR